MKYDFYIVQVIFSIDLPTDQFPHSAELDIDLIDDATDPMRHVRPIHLFPEKRDVVFIKADVEGNFGIDATMNFSRPQLNIMSPYGNLGGKIGGNAGVTAKLVFGPFSYSFRKADIQVFGTSDPHIVWRYILQSELAGRCEFQSVLILKIAQEVRMVKMNALLKVVPAKRNWLIFQKHLPAPPFPATLPVELAVQP